MTNQPPSKSSHHYHPDASAVQETRRTWSYNSLHDTNHISGYVHTASSPGEGTCIAGVSEEASCAVNPQQSTTHRLENRESRIDTTRWGMVTEGQLTLYDGRVLYFSHRAVLLQQTPTIISTSAKKQAWPPANPSKAMLLLSSASPPLRDCLVDTVTLPGVRVLCQLFG